MYEVPKSLQWDEALDSSVIADSYIVVHECDTDSDCEHDHHVITFFCLFLSFLKLNQMLYFVWNS